MRSLYKDTRGQGMVEYILLVALIAIALIGAWRLLKTKVNDQIEKAAGEIEEAGSK